MSDPQTPLFSPAWYRVAGLRPRLRAHARLHRQHFRGGLWFVLHDPVNNRFYRFTPAAHVLIGLMDGRRTMERIWTLAGERLGDELPTQDDVIQLLAQLHHADMLQGDSLPDVAELTERARTQKRRRMMMAVRNPLAVRLPLLDPDRFLDRTFWLVRPLFGPVGLLLWLSVVVAGVATAGLRWPELTSNVYDRVLAAENLLLLLLSYPLVKAVHELGHGYAVKRWGGEVHEIGIMFMVLIPVPYVDASAAHGFQEKRRRMLVGGAGILVELFVAAVALLVWTQLEDGLARALAFNIMLIGGVSTLLFNGNPLLRFDGYYVLADWLEIPNLAQRANRYVFYLCKRYLFGLGSAETPVTARGERGWFLAYATAAFAYRMVIMVAIALLVAGQLFFVGVLLALWAVVMMLLLPLCKGLWYLLSSPELERRRTRSFAVSCAALAVVAGPLFAVPVPSGTVVQGVVWLPERSQIRAPEAGFVAEVAAVPGQWVSAGTPLVELDDPILQARVRVAAAELNEAEVRLASVALSDPLSADIVREQASRAEAELDRLREQRSNMTVAAALAGRFVPVAGRDLEGRYLEKGDLVGYVLEPGTPTLRIAIPQADVQRVAERTRAVAVRLAGRPLETHPARIVRVTPQASRTLPSRVLAVDGGGPIPLDPRDPEGQRALQSVFVVDLAVDAPPRDLAFGTRVHARFDHGSEPLARQVYRAARQLFHDEFDL
jgi:putative peptide zinc metalloprotease protein